ncbi:sterol desaturase family protein [Oecophyllibacter saccharovorans]|uniref:sterol desaturase family protein n=1 Tax=Oecophyllibacter saccharovorans TaxID=2558360 RepID=UPI0011751CFB|nr:sterol desaturase family protein [Oecophyllibacter saccharovorans]TPW34727.1 fatty acid hydroxylase family protein [Oecophyllibacter saccharovorans]
MINPFRNTPFMKKGRSYDLGKMSLKQMWKAYLTYPTILLYFLLILVTVGLSLYFYKGFWQTFIPVPIVVVVFPIVWYIIHRWIMHGRWFYRNPITAAMWKRIHWDHHQDPHLLEVLFGSPLYTLPTMIVVTMPIGGWIGGWSGAFSALATALVMTCIYEFFHTLQHLAYKPKWNWVIYIVQLHILHHFHDEDGNYGITNYLPDRLLGTFYRKAKDRPRSPYVFNLGYTLEEAQLYPWVMQRTGAPPRDRPDPARVPKSPKLSKEAS